MTCGRDIMDIFLQNKHFSNILVVWEARVVVLAVYRASCKMSDNLEGYTIIFPILYYFYFIFLLVKNWSFWLLINNVVALWVCGCVFWENLSLLVTFDLFSFPFPFFKKKKKIRDTHLEFFICLNIKYISF